MAPIILILLAVIWLSVAAVVHALVHRYPWQRLGGARKRVQLVRGLEAVRHALMAMYWLLSVWVLVELFIFLDSREVNGLFLWVLVIAVLAELAARSSWLQTQVLTLLYRGVMAYGQYLRVLYKGLQLVEPWAARLMPDPPLFRDHQELAHLVQYHHRNHQVLSAAQQRQLDMLLGVTTRSISSKMVPLKKAPLIKAEEVIGPLVLSELHDSPYGSFPVYDKRRAKIVGILDQGVAVSHATKGAKIAHIMEERVVYLPHDATYFQALQTFIETSSPISVIIDNEKQPVGVLYVQDILRDLFDTTKE